MSEVLKGWSNSRESKQTQDWIKSTKTQEATNSIWKMRHSQTTVFIGRNCKTSWRQAPSNATHPDQRKHAAVTKIEL